MLLCFIGQDDVMNVEIVNIQLVGRYDLSRLMALGYELVPDSEGAYQFNFRGWSRTGDGPIIFHGVTHRYIFEPIDQQTVGVIIEPKNIDMSLAYQLTFAEINGWLRRCVEVISC